MKASEYCNRDVVIIEKEASVTDAAKLMRQMHVGSVVVVDADGDCRRPLGVLTDRDIVVDFTAVGRSASEVRVGEAMRTDLVTIDESTELFEAIELMRDHGVRRIPVVDGRGCLVGLVASDDALELVSEELSDIVRLVSRQQRSEADRLD